MITRLLVAFAILLKVQEVAIAGKGIRQTDF
jgi:hypothetical protein